MSEVKLYGGLLVGLLVAAYVSHTRQAPPPDEGAVRILDAKPEELEKLELFARTQTVAFAWRSTPEGERYPWFEIESGGARRGFAGSDESKTMLGSFAPFLALRSLGTELSAEELKQVGLAGPKPERRLVLGLRGGARAFEVGGRTSGARDHYVRPEGSREVFLVAARVLADLDLPDGKFMQRKLRSATLAEVERVVLAANGKRVTALHKNRRSQADAFWASESKPDEKDETLANYLDKLEKLSALEYLGDAKAPGGESVVLEVSWVGEKDEALGKLTLSRSGEGETASYRALSTATRTPVKVSRVTGEQLERDLEAVLAL
jgi:hypothetical protein